MKLIDAPAFSYNLDPSLWARMLQTLYPADVVIKSEDDRYGWLSRLQQEQIYTEFSILTTPQARSFWSLLPELIRIEDQFGKTMTKSQRRDLEGWALELATGTSKKAEQKKLLKANPSFTNVIEGYKSRLKNAARPDVTLHDIDGQYDLITPETFPQFALELGNQVKEGIWFGWDTETEQTGEDDTDAINPYTALLVGVSFSTRPKHAFYVPINHIQDQTQNISKDAVAALLQNLYFAASKSGARAVLHNSKYDFSVLGNPRGHTDIEDIYSTWLPQSEDTMLLAALCNRPSAKLKPLAEKEFGVQVVDFKKLTGGRPFSYVPLDHATIYAGQDADWTLRLYPILEAEAKELEVWHLYEDLEKPIIEYFMRMERRGLRIDREALDKAGAELKQGLTFTARQFSKLLGREGINVPSNFNINSGDQVAELLFAPRPRGLSIPILERTPSGSRGSTDEKHINKLLSEGYDHPALRILRAYREQAKLIESYVDPMPGFIQEDGRVRGSFHQLGAATGRTSMTKPAGQTFPPQIQKAIVPEDDGELAGLDYSQIELRVLAATANERKMLAAFARGEDIHASTQRDVGLPTRTLAKNFNFGVSFGAGPATLSDTAGIPRSQAEAFYSRYWETYTDFKTYVDELWESVQKNPWLRTWSGRLRILQPAISRYQEQENRRLMMNTPIQGGALDIAKTAMRDALELLRSVEAIGIHPILMVHDSLVFERESWTPQEEWDDFISKMVEIMEGANPFQELVRMPVDPKRGRNLGECK